MKSEKKKDFEQTIILASNYMEIFNSMDEDILAEIAYYYPQQLYNLCIFLTLDYQLALEEKRRTLN